MPDKASPLWWLAAGVSIAVYVATMWPGMITLGQKVTYSFGAPVAGFLGLLGYCWVYKWPVTEGLPLYCAAILGIAAGMLGHQKTLRAYMADRLAHPGRSQEDAATPPWVLQMVFTMLILCGAALWYVQHS
ncbi:hypothetical protein [Streptomyces sp. NPDC048111]|uniref:hypothetical protein n=1 Tax=Streptomyces sp. NPDC048111 TaxID=3365500 RepID=UPI00371EFCF1